MRRTIFATCLAIIATAASYGQTYLDSTINSSTKRIMFSDPNAFVFGSYGEAHYNQDIVSNTFQNGNMDLHRVIMFMGYKFNSRLQFFSEIEFEHVKEVYVEQAFLNYQFNSLLNFKAGILLIPMGYVNEFHEPTLFNGVERPFVDKYVIPSTWREMGAGFHGIVKQANIKYQLYMVNGFNGYNGSAKLGGSGIRGGRQKGAKATFRTPSFTGKLTYYGLNGLRLGVSGYYGNSETSMYDGLDRNDNVAIASADSSRVGLSMIGVNAHYSLGNLQLTGVGNITNVSGSNAYNEFTGAALGSQIMGWYGEIAYRFNLRSGKEYPKLIPFVRYSEYDTHSKVDRAINKDHGYSKKVTTAGVGLQLTPGTIFKIDYQYLEKGQKTVVSTGKSGFVYDKSILNVGFGYWF